MLEILLEAALRATFIAAAALGVLWSLRVRAAAVRHRVWTVVMLAMLALPLSIAWAPDVSLRVLPPTYVGSVGPRRASVGFHRRRSDSDGACDGRTGQSSRRRLRGTGERG